MGSIRTVRGHPAAPVRVELSVTTRVRCARRVRSQLRCLVGAEVGTETVGEAGETRIKEVPALRQEAAAIPAEAALDLDQVVALALAMAQAQMGRLVYLWGQGRESLLQ